MKPLFLLLLLSTLAFAYEKGDTIDPEMVKYLELKENKVYVIDFFASWCSSCKKELPLISKAKDNSDENKVEFIGIDVDKDIKKGLAFQADLKKDGHLNFKIINDPQNVIVSKFNPTGMPTLYYVKNHIILEITTGAVADIDEHIINYLKGIQK